MIPKQLFEMITIILNIFVVTRSVLPLLEFTVIEMKLYDLIRTEMPYIVLKYFLRVYTDYRDKYKWEQTLKDPVANGGFVRPGAPCIYRLQSTVIALASGKVELAYRYRFPSSRDYRYI